VLAMDDSSSKRINEQSSVLLIRGFGWGGNGSQGSAPGRPIRDGRGLLG
jgi:hypothetical protein